MDTTASDWISRGIDALKRDPHRWRLAIRRAYVLTWPVSLLLRGVLLVGLFAAWLTASFAEFLTYRLGCIWRGKRRGGWGWWTWWR